MNQHLEKLVHLAPVIQTSAREMIRRCERDLKRTLLVVRTWASYEEQLKIYAQGRHKDATGKWAVLDPTRIVSNAAPGQSAHNVIDQLHMPAALALDVIPLLPDGTPDWKVGLAFWQSLYKIAWKCGLDPLGDQVGAYLAGDLGHFEEPSWKLKLETWKEYMQP